MDSLTTRRAARVLHGLAPVVITFSMIGSVSAEDCAWIQDPNRGANASDATVASQQGEEAGKPTAGHNGSVFYLGSPNGDFTMEFNGLLQFRGIGNIRGSETGRSSTSPDDNTELGFEFRRIELALQGNVYDVGYKLVLATEDGAAGVEQIIAQDVAVSYDLTDNLKITAGRYFAPFLREESIGGGGSLAVALSYMNNSLSIGRAEGVSLIHESDRFRGNIFLNDGAGSGGGGGVNNPFADAVDWAVTARADVRLAGDWGQWGDYSASADDPTGAFLGAAVHYQMGESGDSVAANDVDAVMWTVDASVEWKRLNLFIAAAGNHADSGTSSDLDDHGIVAQGGYMTASGTWEPFLRYEFLSFDRDRGYVAKEVSLVTVGTNYHCSKRLKLGLDVVWALDAMPTDSLNAGLLADGVEENQVVARVQAQVKF